MKKHAWFQWREIAVISCICIISIGAFSKNTSPEAAPSLDDAVIRLAVEKELFSDSGVPDHLITVEASNGIVILKGGVDNIMAMERAACIAQTVKGVRVVINRILVIPIVPRSDEALKADVQEALIQNRVADANEASVRVENGTVFLSGTVDSWQEYRFCERAAKGVKGVVHVQNDLYVEYALNRPDAEIQAELIERLRWDVLVDHGLIQVRVSDGVVILSGTVGSAAEKMRAVYDSYIAGVASVDASELEVADWARDTHLQGRKSLFKSDSEIKKAVTDAFRYDPRVSFFGVQVQVSDGVVTLRGEVDTIGAKRAAGQDASNTAGVRNVENRIKVRPARPAGRPGSKELIQSAIARDPYLNSERILVSVSNGVARLFGVVDTTFEKRRAEDVVSELDGIMWVDNNLIAERRGPIPYQRHAGDPHPYDYEWHRRDHHE